MNLSHMLGAVDDWFKVVGGIAGEAINFIGFIFYAIFTGIGMLIEFVLQLFKKFAGIEQMTLTVNNKYITVGGEGSWTDMSYAFITSDAVSTAFWTIFAMCIALLVVFTIFAIVKSEFSTDVKTAAKLPILERAVKSVINFLLIPVISFFSIYGANMLTKTVYYTFNTDSSYCISNVVFNAGALTANRVSQDDGFANYLLSTETVYFANEERVDARTQVVSMLDNYFTVPEGYIKVYKVTAKRVSSGDNGIDYSGELLDSRTLKPGDTITSTVGDSLHIADELGHRNNVYSSKVISNRAGLFYLQETKSPGSEIGDEVSYYSFEIQLPVTVTYVDLDTGFRQLVYSASVSSEGSYSTVFNFRVLAPVEGATTLGKVGKTSYLFGKSSRGIVSSDDVSKWWDPEGKNDKFQLCKDVDSSDLELIASTINNYVRVLDANSDMEALGGTDLWDVLKAEYNTETDTIFGDKPSSSDKISVQAITQAQRNKLADFINRIFVGNGSGGSAYAKYAVFDGSGNFTLEEWTDKEVEERLKKGTLESDKYLKISSETLHVERHSRADLQKIVGDTQDWSVDFTPDYQQVWWSPSTFGGEAVMDIGLVGYFFKFNNMNLVMMLFGLVAIAWQYFKLILVFVKRALEMVLLFLMAPIVTAIAPLDKGNAESSWRSNWIKQLTMTAVPVFAINVFFTIVPLVTSIAPFGDGGSIINPLYNTYNAFVSIIFIYVGVSMINKASALLAGFLGTDDMIAQGKDLTNKAVGVAATAAKGAALVGGISLAGPAAAIKMGLGAASGARAAQASKESSRKAAMADLEAQMDTAKAEGNENREYDLKTRAYDFDSFAKMSSSERGKEIKRAQGARDRYLNDIDELNKANAPDLSEIEQLQAKQKELASRPMRMGKQKKWDDAAKAQWQQEQADVASQIANKQQAIAARNKEIESKRKFVRDYGDDIRFYSSFDQAKEDARDARAAAYKEARDRSLADRVKSGQKIYDDSVGEFMKETPVVRSIGGALNWAVDKALFGSLGVAAQIADRKLTSTPKNLADFVKGVDGTGGTIVEKILDPGTLGKTISTSDENKKRETQKEEKARAEVWKENAEREKKKVEAEEKAMRELQKKEATMQQLRDWETYKMGGFNIKGDKIDVNADRNETVAKNYKAVIDKRAEQDYKNELHKTDKDFEKFKKLLKDSQAEGKKQAQNVKIDPSDKSMTEKITQAMKKVNSQQSRELKNVNAGISSLLAEMKKLVEKMDNK